MYIPQKGQGLTHAGADVGFRASISTSRMSLVCLQEPVAWALGIFSLGRRFKTLSGSTDSQSDRSKPVVHSMVSVSAISEISSRRFLQRRGRSLEGRWNDNARYGIGGIGAVVKVGRGLFVE